MSATYLAYVINIAFQVYTYIVIARVLSSWIRLSPYGKIYQFLFSMTEPLLAPIRKLMPRTMMLDFSPMILIFLLILLRRLLMMLMYSIF